MLMQQLVGFGASRASALISSGLVGRWQMTEGTGTTVADSSGNGRNASLTNAPPWVAGPAGGGAVSFNGSTQYASIADNAAFSPKTTNEITIAFWGNFAVASGYAVAKSGASGDYEFAIGPGTFTIWQLIGSTHAGAAITIPATGEWVHLAGTFKAATEIITYVNGSVSNTSTSFTGSIADGPGAVNFGRRPDNTNYCNGSLHDVRIYNRALTAGEINLIANFDG